MKNLNIGRNSKVLLTTAMVSLSVLFTSCGSGTSSKNLSIPGVDGPSVVLLGDNILIDIVMQNLTIQGGARYNIPKYPNSYLEISPDLQSDGTIIAFSISLDDIFGGSAGRLDPLSLPGGRPIPGVSGGALPAIAFSVAKLKNMAFYIGPKIFGIWIPIKGMNMNGAMITSRFYTGSKRVGNLSLIGEDQNGENAGLFLALLVSNTQKKALSKIADRN